MGIPREIAERIANGKMPWLGKKEQDNKNRGELKNWHRDKAEPTDKMPRTRAEIAQNMERVSKGDLSKNTKAKIKTDTVIRGLRYRYTETPKPGAKLYTPISRGRTFPINLANPTVSKVPYK